MDLALQAAWAAAFTAFAVFRDTTLPAVFDGLSNLVGRYTVTAMSNRDFKIVIGGSAMTVALIDETGNVNCRGPNANDIVTTQYTAAGAAKIAEPCSRAS